jgi:hypothetical protein
MKHGTHQCPAHTITQTHTHTHTLSLTTLKRLCSLLVFLLGFHTSTYAQSHAPAQISLSVGSTPSGQAPDTATLTFTSEPETYHFIQGSDSLQQWDYLPHATYGDDTQTQMQMQLSPTGSAHFYRIQSTDDLSQAPASLDFDNDGISNADELRAGTPYHFFKAESLDDTDQDGLPDYWETFYFGDLSQSANDDFDADGIKNAYEWQVRTNPTIDETTQVFSRDSFTYDNRGWLNGFHFMNSFSTSLMHDAEGNPTAQN